MQKSKNLVRSRQQEWRRKFQLELKSENWKKRNLKSSLRQSFRNIDHRRAHQGPKRRMVRLLARTDKSHKGLLEPTKPLQIALLKISIARSSHEKIRRINPIPNQLVRQFPQGDRNLRGYSQIERVS